MLGLDPIDQSKCQVTKTYEDKTIDSMVKDGSILIYDERYSPVENIQFESLVNNQQFELLKVFVPEQTLKVTGRDYKIAIFKKI